MVSESGGVADLDARRPRALGVVTRKRTPVLRARGGGTVEAAHNGDPRLWLEAEGSVFHSRFDGHQPRAMV